MLCMFQPLVQTWQCWENWEDALFTCLRLSSCQVLQAMYVPDVLIKDALILSKSCGKNSLYGRVKSLSSQLMQYMAYPSLSGEY